MKHRVWMDLPAQWTARDRTVQVPISTAFDSGDKALEWAESLGLNDWVVKAEPDGTKAAAAETNLYTVFGLANDETEEFIVAGIVSGEANCVDTRGGEDGWLRWASSFEADSPDEAVKMARLAADEEIKIPRGDAG